MDSVGCRADSKDKRPSKFCSAKLWITIWAMAMVTFIIITGKSEFNSVLMMLSGVPVAYMGVNVWQKHIYAGKEKDVGAGELFDTLFPNDGKGEWSADTQKEGQ